MQKTSAEAARSALGFAQRAGKVIAGDFAVEKAVKGKKVRLVVLDMETSEATCSRYEGLCTRNGIPCLLMENMDAAIGRYGKKIAAVTDDGFSRMILDKTIQGG